MPAAREAEHGRDLLVEVLFVAAVGQQRAQRHREFRLRPQHPGVAGEQGLQALRRVHVAQHADLVASGGDRRQGDPQLARRGGHFVVGAGPGHHMRHRAGMVDEAELHRRGPHRLTHLARPGWRPRPRAHRHSRPVRPGRRAGNGGAGVAGRQLARARPARAHRAPPAPAPRRPRPQRSPGFPAVRAEAQRQQGAGLRRQVDQVALVVFAVFQRAVVQALGQQAAHRVARDVARQLAAVGAHPRIGRTQVAEVGIAVDIAGDAIRVLGAQHRVVQEDRPGIHGHAAPPRSLAQVGQQVRRRRPRRPCAAPARCGSGSSRG